MLAEPPKWDRPAVALEFGEMPEGERLVSPANEDPFAIANGALVVTAKAHTYAFIKVPLVGHVSGFEARLRLGSDGGQSWGPGVLVEMEGAARIRVGLRSDGMAQLDVLGGQRVGGQHSTHVDGRWAHLRARWLDTRKKMISKKTTSIMGVILNATSPRRCQIAGRIWEFPDQEERERGVLTGGGVATVVGIGCARLRGRQTCCRTWAASATNWSTRLRKMA